MRNRSNRRRGNYGREEYRQGIFSNRDDLYRTNARDYEGRDYYDEALVRDDEQLHKRRSSYERDGLRRGRMRHTRAGKNTADRSADRIHDAWDRFSNHPDQRYEWEYDNARLAREYGEGTKDGFGYSRYPAEEYGDYRMGPIDDFEYYEDVRHRAYDDTRYGEEGGYSDVWRGERNLDWIRHPRSARRRRRDTHER
jgi:hypothetical protein